MAAITPARLDRLVVLGIATVGPLLFLNGPETNRSTYQKLLVAVLVMRAALRWRQFARRLAYVVPLAFYVFWAVVSSSWSVNPSATRIASGYLVASLLLGLHLSVEFTRREQARILAFSGLVIVGFNSYSVYRSYWRHPFSVPFFLSGPYHDSGYLALALAFGVSLMLLGLAHRKWFWGVALVLLPAAVFLVVRTRNVTSLLSLLLSAAILGVCAAGLSRVTTRAGAMARVAVMSIAPAALIVFLVAPERVGRLLRFKSVAITRVRSLDGRTTIWEQVWPWFTNRPLRGYGYAAVWTNESPFVTPIERSIQPVHRTFHAHNIFVETLLGLGLIGLLVVLVVFVSAFVRAFADLRRGRTVLDAWPLMFMVLLLASGWTESVPFSAPSTHVALLAAVLAGSLGDDASLRRRSFARQEPVPPDRVGSDRMAPAGVASRS